LAQDLNSLTTNEYQANLYAARPLAADASTPKLGVCVSGGGSRALSCALGQFSGLRSLSDPDNPAQTILDRVDYLSSVSGGSWASVLFTFLPKTVGGKPVTDDDFLISPGEPQDLVKQAESTDSPLNVVYMNPLCLGTTPQRFNPVVIAEYLYTLHEWGFLSNPKKWRWFWIAAVGDIVLKPFGLYDAQYDKDKTFIEPARYFSLSDEHVKNRIMGENPTLKPEEFYVARQGRPSLFVNTNILQDRDEGLPPQTPVQSNPIDTGVLGRSPDGSIVGGGSVESFGFTSTLEGKGKYPATASVTLQRRYSLCDIAGCSSAFFAEYLLRYLADGIDDVISEVEQFLIKELHFLPSVAKFTAGLVKAELEPFLDVEVAKLIPQYNYWPLGEVDKPDPANTTHGFSDGGNFDNTGILGMLARTNVSHIISFVNSEKPISRESPQSEVVLAGQVPLLFGYKALPKGGKYVSYGGMDPSEPMSYVQVFSDENQEFAALREGLYNASCGGPGKGDDLATYTAAFTQSLTTVHNPVAHIEGGRTVTVLWVYNNRVNSWQQAITDSEIKTDLAKGQSNQNQNGTPINTNGAGSGPVANFPWYSTGSQIYVDKEGVNMLAQLSAWNVRQLSAEICKLLAT